MFDHDSCTVLEKEKFRLLCAYETAVLSLLQKANGNEAFDNSDDEKQSQAKTVTMDEEASEVQSHKMDEESAVATGPYPALRSDKNFSHRMFGVSNIGNTCFFNATMQCLNASRPFVQHYVLSQDEYKKYNEYLGSMIRFTQNMTTSTSDTQNSWQKETSTRTARSVHVRCSIRSV
jgi:ubiquitin C-terminal hydrolase